MAPGRCRGLKEAADAIAGDKLVFKPQPVGDLRYAETSRLLPNGTAKVHWKRTGRPVHDVVEVPANTTAEVWVPTTRSTRARDPHARHVQAGRG